MVKLLFNFDAYILIKLNYLLNLINLITTKTSTLTLFNSNYSLIEIYFGDAKDLFYDNSPSIFVLRRSSNLRFSTIIKETNKRREDDRVINLTEQMLPTLCQ